MPCWQSLSIPKSISMAEIVSKEAQKKSKAGICFRLSSHNKHTSLEARYLNENPAPSLEDVGLPGTAGTSGLNSRDKSSGKEKPIGDSVDPDRLPELQTIIVPEVTMTEPARPDQRGYTREDYVLITPDETLTLEAIPRGNPKLTSCTSSAYEHPSDGLAQNLNLQNHAPTLVSDIIRLRLHKAVSHVLRTEQITLTSSPALSSTNITILEFKETLYEMMTNNLDSIIGDMKTDLYIALSKFVEQDKQTVPKDSCKTTNVRKQTHDNQDHPDNHEGEKRYKKSIFASQSSIRNDQAMYDASDRDKQLLSTGKTREHPRWFIAAPAEYTDYLWVTSSDAKERFNEVVDTYPYPEVYLCLSVKVFSVFAFAGFDSCSSL
ncbi:hypothetical protein Tco_1057720 [Tanacetum coccineum]|uniref:Uncharacterized protein n=1 Tax=Tanacetum coccineum TaxID=301880 RepID=A0ABQ5H899_9ASTR